MKTKTLWKLGLILAGCSALVGSAPAGTYKQITIDGSFGDWAGIAPAFSRATPDTTTSVAYKDIYVANDENYLYIRFTIFTAADPFTSHENIFVDADNNLGTGFPAAASRLGSEMLIQSGTGYQERDGGFNEGAINNLGWASAPAAPATDFEVRISRAAAYASDSTPVFTSDTIAFLLEAEDAGWNPVEFAPPDAGLVYTFEPPPAVLTTNQTLLQLTGNTWQVNQSGTDLGTAWLDQTYDDTQAGWSSGLGLFGYTPTPGAYPPIQTSLTGGPNAYYFRAHFLWTNSSANLAFVVTNFLSDGAVFYVNGTEVRRVRMPAGTVGYQTNATANASPVGSADVFGIPGAALVIGDNLFEVETHQAPASSLDMVLGLSLTAAAQYPILIVDPTQPTNRTVLAGNSTLFAAEILGSSPLSYQWLKDEGAIPNATNATYTIPLVLPGDAAAYSLRVSNPLSTNTTRAAVLTVTGTPVVLTDLTQPQDQTMVEGNPATFTVAASGSAPLQYQWFKGSTSIGDATNSSYTIPFVLPGDAGSYHANVSNPVSSTNSRSAVLTVLRDTKAPALMDAQGSPNTVTVTFSEPVDPATAGASGNYTLNGGVNVLSAAVVPGSPTQVALTTSAQTLGTVYTLTVNGVRDLFGNSVLRESRVAFLSTIVIDGLFADWQTLSPIYTADSNSPTATNFKDVYIYNDADYLYFRVTTWDPTILQIWYNNYFFDTDNDASTGYTPWGGSDMLIQGGTGYDERDGQFSSAAGILGLDWLCVPGDTGTNFEFRVSLAATFDTDGHPVFTNSIVNFAFDGENTSYVTMNRVPASGTLSYTLVASPPVPPGPLALDLSGGQLSVTWMGPGTLQACGALVNPVWTNVPSATSPYIIPAVGAPRFFRLTQ